MEHKKKQIAALVMSGALSVGAVLSPVAVHAQKEAPSTAITRESAGKPIQEDESSTRGRYGQRAKANNTTKDTERRMNNVENSQIYAQALSIPRLPTEGEVAIDSKNFPDPIFRQYVKNNFDKYKDNVLTKDELNNITDIRIENTLDLKDLTGIEHMKNLTILMCRGTGITKLDISHNLLLEYLACDNTNISRLNTSSNTLLKSLFTSNTLIENLDVSNNMKLEYLGCHNTKIKDLDVSNNKALSWLYCSRNKNLTSLTIAGADALEHLECDETDIADLDVSNNPNLRVLTCYDTAIKNLNIKNNPKLTHLQCFRTKLKRLDVSQNINLEELNCSNTQIEELDVSMLTSLKSLWVWQTGIRYLNVSNNPELKLLDTPQTNLAYLDWGKADLDELYMDSATSINLTINSQSFDMTQAFQGIDISKVTVLSGARTDGNHFTDYQVGTPIIYEYDCGTANGKPVTLRVTLNLLKSDSKINIESSLDKEYTGKPYEIPEIKTEGSKGELTFTYSEYINGNYERIETAPTNVGKYAVYIELAEDEYYEGAVIEQTFFEITQAKNDWTNEPVIKDWKVGDTPNTPSATAKFGDVVFTYSDSENGTYTSEVPTNAGTWYVKSIVTGTENYTGLESIKAFTIHKQDTPAPENPKDNPVKPGGIVKTGDNGRPVLLATLIALSAGCAAFLTGKKRKRHLKESK